MNIKWEQTAKQNIAWGYLNDKTTTEILFGGGAGGSKTFLGCAWIIIQCGRYKGSRWVIARETLKRLKETTLVTFFSICSKWGFKANVHYIYNQQDSTITWANGSVILLKELFAYPSDPEFDSLGSLEITGAFIDEVAQVSEKAKQVLKTRIRHNLTEYGICPKLLMSCNPTKNWAYKEFYLPHREGKLPEHKKFIQSLVLDNPFIDQSYVENLKSLPDGAIKQRLLYGNWEYDDDPSRLLDYEDIMDIFTNTPDPSDTWYISCDVARFGTDSTMIGLWKGLHCKAIFKYQRKSTTEVVGVLEALCAKYQVRRSNVVVDEDGVGGGVVDQFKGCVGFVNNSSPIRKKHEKNQKNYANLKTQCYFEFARLVKLGKIRVYTSDENIKSMLIEELGQLKEKDIDKDGRISLISKEVIKQNIGRSPDISDMLMMRMIFEIKKVNSFDPIFV